MSTNEERPEEVVELPPGLQAVARLLDRVAEDENRTLDQAAELGDVPGLDRVEALREQAPPQPEKAAKSLGQKRGLVWVLAAAAVAAALLLFVRRAPTPGAERVGQEDVLLTAGGVELAPLSPDGGRELRWDAAGFAGANGSTGMHYDVRLIGLLEDGSEELLHRERTEVPRLTLPSAETWPDTVLLEIDVTDGGGRLVDEVRELLDFSSR